MEDFETLYQQHLPAVFRYALRCVGRRDIAEEVVADAFLSLYRNRDRIDVAQLPGWLLTVVRNRSIDYWRRVRLEQRTATEAVKSLSAETVQEHETLDGLLEQCKALKPAHRACLLLRFARGMTRAEIARELGMTENQVKGALQYALELLRGAFPESVLGRQSHG